MPSRLGSATAALRQRQATVVDAATVATRRVWAGLDPHALDASWATARPAASRAVRVSQRLAAAAGQPYIMAALAAQTVRPRARRTVDPSAFAGTTAPGRPLEEVLDWPVVAAKAASARGMAVPDAMGLGARALAALVATVLHDTIRAAVQCAAVAEPAVLSFVREASPGACEACAALSGEQADVTGDFPRHPSCDCQRVPLADDGGGTRHEAGAADTEGLYAGPDAPGAGSGDLSPEQAVAAAGGDRAAALDLLIENGYLT